MKILDDLISVYGIAESFPDGSKAFKQLQLRDILMIPPENPDIEQIVSISADIEITRVKVISAASGKSAEGQVLSGRKLIVEGKVIQKLEYIADSPVQPVQGAGFSSPFSSFIVLGGDIGFYPEFDVRGYVEDIYIKQLDKRRVYRNLLLLLDAVPATKI